MKDYELVKVLVERGFFKNFSVLARVFYMRPEQMNRVKNGQQHLRPEIREALESLLNDEDPQHTRYSPLVRAGLLTGEIVDLRKDRKVGPWEIRIMKGRGKDKIVWVEDSDHEKILERLKAAKLGLEYESC